MQELDIGPDCAWGHDRNACLALTETGPVVDSLQASMLIASAIRQASGPFLLKGIRISRKFDKKMTLEAGQRIRLNPAWPDLVQIVEVRDDGLVLERAPT